MGIRSQPRIVIKKSSVSGTPVIVAVPSRPLQIRETKINLADLEKATATDPINLPGLHRALETFIRKTGNKVSKHTREGYLQLLDVKGQTRYSLRFNRCDIDVVQDGKLVNAAGSITISISKWNKRQATQLLMQLLPDGTLQWHPRSGSGAIDEEVFDSRGSDAIEVTIKGRELWRRIIKHWSS